MQVDYIHGNPIEKPTIAAVKAAWGKKIAAANPAKKATNKVAKKAAKKPTKPIKKSSSSKITLEEARELFSKKPTGESTMAVKKKARSAAQKAATKRMLAANKAKRTKKVAKKTTKKVAKKHVAKKAVKKVAKKHVAKKVVKRAVRKISAKKAKLHKGIKPLKHVVAMSSHGVSGSVKKAGKTVYTKNYRKATGVKTKGGTKLPMASRLLYKGEKMAGHVSRQLKRGKRVITKEFDFDVVRTNPRKKHAKKRNPIIVSNPKKHKKHAKKRNPLVVSKNPRFMKNPMGAIVAMESKIVSALAPINAITEKFLNVGVLEIAGLAVGAGLDGMVLSLVKKIPKSDLVLAHIPAEYQAPAVMGLGGLVLHALNAFVAKKGGKKSVVLDELSKGMIAAALVKSIASFSVLSSENDVALAGYIHTPAMSGAGFNGYIHSNPSASMKVGSSDFSGADFQGADFQGHDTVAGADFDGYVTSMGGDDADDYGTDEHSMNGAW